MANLAANDRLSLWLQVFNNSKVNGAPYLGDDLPAHRWTWPTDTYMRRRLRSLHAHGGDETTTPNLTDNRRDNLLFRSLAHERPDPRAGNPKKARKRRISRDA
ncbi:MAG: hypothetical protein ACXWZE_08990, partial [Candidatus Binatia bacterium]